jgi:type IX secretion system PorP/SprF family membrane protein
MRMYRNILTMMFFLCLKISIAQDPSFSQFLFNKVYFNPAFTGFNKRIEGGITQRVLWPKLTGSFNTACFNLHTVISEQQNGFGGVGLLGFYDEEGQGCLKTQSVGLPFSFRPKSLANSKEPDFDFQAGFNVSVNQKSINWEQFVFSDQFDEVKGIVRPSSFGNQIESSKVYPDVSFGMVFTHKLRKEKYSIDYGFALHHLTQPKVSFTNFDSHIPLKQVYHIQLNMYEPTKPASEDIQFTSYFVYEQQQSMKTFHFGFAAAYDIFYSGVSYRLFRNSDALQIMAGCSIPLKIENTELIILYTYDLTISGLLLPTGGSHEICIVYKKQISTFGTRKSKDNRRCFNKF